MRWFILTVVVVSLAATTQAHHPDRRRHPVYPYFDLIGPVGTRLPMSYRRKYNRPTNIGGRIAYHIAPSSQEAMAWHNATHRGHYKNHRPRMVMHYFYPKPWESLRIGARPKTTGDDNSGDSSTIEEAPRYQLDASDEEVEYLPEPIDEPIALEDELIEQQ
jgi:hypothetical protein